MIIVELSHHLLFPKSTLYRLADEGKVPGQNVGRHWCFHREAIDRWLEENAGAGSAEGGEG